MTIFLRQSTASQEIPLGYFVDSTDGNTEETGLTIANTDIKVWKTGATTLANKNSGGATHISNGIYYAVLDATDTDTIGPLRIFVHVSGALSVKVDCVVLDEAVYDTVFGTTALSTFATGGSVNVSSISGDSTAADNAEAFFDGTGYAGTNNVIPTVTTVGTVTAVTALTAAHSEPTGAPAANESILDKIGYIFAALRNGMTVTSSAKTFKDDAGATLWSKTLSDDGTTYTEGEGA